MATDHQVAPLSVGDTFLDYDVVWIEPTSNYFFIVFNPKNHKFRMGFDNVVHGPPFHTKREAKQAMAVRVLARARTIKQNAEHDLVMAREMRRMALRMKRGLE